MKVGGIGMHQKLSFAGCWHNMLTADSLVPDAITLRIDLKRKRTPFGEFWPAAP